MNGSLIFWIKLGYRPNFDLKPNLIRKIKCCWSSVETQFNTGYFSKTEVNLSFGLKPGFMFKLSYTACV